MTYALPRSRRRAAFAAVAGGLLALSSVPVGFAAERDADAVVMTCRATFRMTVSGLTGEAQGNGSVRCTSLSRPDLVGGSIEMQGTFSRAGSTVTTNTTDRIFFPSTGDRIVLTMTRTFENNFGQVRETGSGNTTAGVFHPARETESGSGTADGTGTIFELNPVDMTFEQ
ncbi:hypothetical protein [Streptomyces sp. URMC 123]|uniref:hypothetical protein n=1 Tax=Streptomyces sp. URMC 123 TaxID=3423403 RepID=UPI003F1BAAD8